MLIAGYEDVARFLLDNDNYLIVSHANPDGDTLGSASALVMLLRRKGKSAWAYCPDTIPEKLRKFAPKDIFSDTVIENCVSVAVDVASPQLLGKDKDALLPFDLVIDHHSGNTLPCERLLLESSFISNAEIIAALYDQLSVSIDYKAAECLYAAISSDSGGFRYSNTRPETMRLAARLMETGIDFSAINRILFDQMPTSALMLVREAYNSVKTYYEGKVAVVTVSKEICEKYNVSESDFDEIKNVPRRIEGVEIAALIRPKGDFSQVSLRSNEYFDVAEFCRQHGGGGHARAAAFRIEKTPQQAELYLIKALEGQI